MDVYLGPLACKTNREVVGNRDFLLEESDCLENIEAPSLSLLRPFGMNVTRGT